MKPPTVLVAVSCHPPEVFTSVCGSVAVTWGTLKWRMRGLFAAAISSFAFFEAATLHSMFDWPEQNHTSPTTTSLNSTLFFPLTVNFAPVALAFKGVSATDHLPSFAVVSAFCPANSTVTFSPSSAQPQTGTFWSRWRTMRSLKMTGSFTSAWA